MIRCARTLLPYKLGDAARGTARFFGERFFLQFFFTEARTYSRARVEWLVSHHWMSVETSSVKMVNITTEVARQPIMSANEMNTGCEPMITRYNTSAQKGACQSPSGADNTERIRYGRTLLLHKRFADDARGANFARVARRLNK